MAVGNIFIRDYPGTVGAAGGTADFTVTYDYFKTVSLAEYSDSTGTYQVAGNVVDVGNNSTTYEYSFNIGPNNTGDTHIWPVTFSGIDEEDTRVTEYAGINQLAEYIPDFNVFISPWQYTIGPETQSLTSSISIEGLLDFGNLGIYVNSFDNNVVSANITEPYQVGDYLWASTLEIRMYPNETANPVTSSIEIYAEETGRGVSSTASVTIYQEPGSGSSYRVEAPTTWSVPQAGGNNLELSPVTYYGGTGSAIDAPTYPNWITGWASSSYQGVNTYTFNVQPNNNSFSRAGNIVFGMGGGQATASTRVTQLGLDDTLEVTVSPATSTVGSYTTQSNIVVNYIGAVGYVTESSVSGPGSPTLVLSSSTVSGNDIIARYKVLYPSNSTDDTLTRTATFKIKSGSQVKASASSVITQLPYAPYESIYVNPGTTVIPYNQTSLQVQVFYSGISSLDNITAPVANMDGWSANMASYVASPTDVSVIWNITGTNNVGASSRQIVFTFNAVGIDSEGTLIITQNGTGEEPLVGSGSIVAWKDTETVIGSGDSWEAISVDANNTLLFDERIYKAPDQNTLVINFNRLAESFLEPRSFYTASHYTPVFSFTTTLTEGGEELKYEYKVIDDWSYDNSVDPEISHSLSRPYQKEVALGQYLIYSVQGEDGTYRIRHNSTQVIQRATVEGSYLDLVHKIDDCGTWTVRKNSSDIESFWTVDAKYVLYYYNKYGGWDSFIIKGTVVPSVNTTRSNYLNTRRNSRSYQVGVIDNYKVNSGILTDEESPVVSELASSPRLILHDLKKDSLIPVKVTTNSIEKKTFWNQGHKFATYQFNLEADLNQIRR